MSTATNKAIVRQYFQEVVREGRTDLLEELLAENFELHGTDLEPGLEALKQWYTMFAEAFPDQQLTIDDMIAEGDKVVVRITLNGTHLGEMEGIPATGKPVTQPSIIIYRLANGKIVEGWFASDNLSLMQQLGVVPALQAS
jgi:steroid delta-isomerase-like uncharacterized protein